MVVARGGEMGAGVWGDGTGHRAAFARTVNEERTTTAAGASEDRQVDGKREGEGPHLLIKGLP